MVSQIVLSLIILGVFSQSSSENSTSFIRQYSEVAVVRYQAFGGKKFGGWGGLEHVLTIPQYGVMDSIMIKHNYHRNNPKKDRGQHFIHVYMIVPCKSNLLRGFAALGGFSEQSNLDLV